MEGSKKRTIRFLSVFMSLIMFVCGYLAVPSEVLAEVLAAELETRANVREYSKANAFTGETGVKYSKLAGEEESLRGEDTRTFRREDGMYEAVIYAGAVAYRDGEGYRLIDNTLEKTEEGYTNRASDLRVTFGEDTETEELVKMEAGGSLLSWYMGGFHTGEEKTEGSEEVEELPGEDDSVIEEAEEPGEEVPAPAEEDAEETPKEEAVTEEPVSAEETEPAEEPAETPAEETIEEAVPEQDDPGLEESEEADTEGPAPVEKTTEEAPEEAVTEDPVPTEETEPVGEMTGEEVSGEEAEEPEEELPEEDDSVIEETEETVEETPAPAEETEEETEAAEEPAEEDILSETEEEQPEETVIGEMLRGLSRFSAKAEVIETETVERTETEDEEADMLLRFPPEQTSEIRYRDKETGIELRYILSGKTVSEHVTLNEYPGKDFYWCSVIRWDGEVKDNGDGTYGFYGKDGEESFRLGLPSMEDAAGEYSEDIVTSIEPAGDGQWLYTVRPAEEWLEKAIYPVTVDPDFSADFRNNVTDTYIEPKNPTAAHGSGTELASYTSGTMILLKVANTALPALASGDAVTYAALHMAKSNTDGGHYNTAVAGYPVTSGWNDSTTYNTRPAYESEAVTAGVSSKRYTYTEFDITSTVRDWYEEPAGNYGLMLKSASSASTAFYSSESGTTQYRPYFTVTYRNSTGLEDTWTYYGQDAGRAGAGSVNLFSGNLTWVHADAGITNGVMGVTVNHVYNANDKDTDIGYGNGWRLNYSQSVEKEEIQNTSGTTVYYKLTDGDGTRHWYKFESGSRYVNELDKDTSLTVNDDHTLTVKDKGDNTMTFALDGTDTVGRLTEVADAAGNRTLIGYADNSTDGDGNLTAEAAGDLRIASVGEALNGQAETARQSVTFTYSGGVLDTVVPPDGLEVSYTYTDGCLTETEYADGKACAYEYDQNGLLTEVNNIDGYSLVYGYTGATPFKVTAATEYAGSTQGRSLAFTYRRQQTTVTDERGRKTEYALDYIGQPVSVTDSGDRAVYAAYKTADREVTELSAVSKTQDTVYNLLLNHGFERSSSLTGWTASSASVNTSTVHTGKRSAKLSAGGSISQAAAVETGKSYTLSAWVKGAGVTLSAGGNTSAASTSSDWERIYVTFTASGTSVTAAAAATGTAYVDEVQLEKGEVPSRYNLVDNSDFSKDLSNWTVNYASTNGIATDTRFGKVGKLCQQLKTNTLQQKLFYSGSTGDVYSVGVWVKCDDYPESQQLYWYASGSTYKTHYQTLGKKRIKLEFLNSSGSVLDTVYRDITPGSTGWQFLSFSAAAGHNYSSINFVAEYGFALNTMYIDGVQVFREEFSQGYTYDAKGNLKSYTSLLGQTDSFDYDEHDNVTKSTDALGHSTNYSYYGADSTGNPTGSTHLVKDVTTPEGIKTSYTYNDKGQILETETGGTDLYIRSSAVYNSAGLTASVTDAQGNSAAYTYDSDTRQTETVTDALNNVSAYGYGNASEMLRLAELVSAGTGKVEYGYDTNGRLTTVTRDEDASGSATAGTVYRMTYDIWGRTAATSVDTQALSSNTYDSYGRLVSVVYGNGYRTEYSYDALDRVASVSRGTGSNVPLAFTYTYDGEGNLYELRNFETHRSTVFRYDHAGRCMASVEKTFTGSGNGISYTGTAASYRYEYDACNRLSKLTCGTGNDTWETVYTYDNDGKAKTVTLQNGKVLTNTYDSLGRLQYRDIGLNSNYRTVLTYLAGTGGSSTALLATYTNGSDDAYSYTYDANGNITEITQGSTSVSYSYNAANELIRENNGFTGETVLYSYDPWGNILDKVTYAYTTAEEPQSPAETVIYSYGNTVWHDELTGLSITTAAGTETQVFTYDNNGNALTYRGASLTWEGKQLAGYTKGTDTLSFTYDDNGLRLSKTHNNETTSYYYNGSVLMSLVKGNDTLLFSYDQGGNVVSVNYNGTDYYYLRNGQGDIVKLIDGSGSTVVEYSYNSWGEQTGCVGTLSTTLGVLNPFRYRGYVYDEETGLYYLQSRYYDPDLCRFISADVFLSTGQGVLGCNAFAYCGNEPVVLYDDSGTQSRPIDPTCAGSSDTAGIIFMLTTAGVSSVILPFIESCVNYLTDRVDEMATVLKKSAEAVIKGTMTHRNQSVYVMYYASGENAGKVGYVGRTNDPIRRKRAHMLDTKKENLTDFTVVKTNMTKTGARFLEQALISAYGLQSLDNKIRGIAREKSGLFVAARQQFDLFYGYIESEVLSLFER